MARDYAKQKLFAPAGYRLDTGYQAFTTTGATTEIYTPLRKIWAADIQSISNTAVPEKMWINETYQAGGHINVSGGSVTVQRAVDLDPVQLSVSPEDTAFLSTNDWLSVPVGIAPFNGTITGLKVWNKTKASGALIALGRIAPTVTLLDSAGGTSGFVAGDEVTQATSNARGIVISEAVDAGAITLVVRTIEGQWGTGEVTVVGGGATPTMTPSDGNTPTAAVADAFIDAGNAWGMPESGYQLEIRSTDITVGDSANEITSVTVVEGDVIIFGTSSGGGVPSGLFVQVEITPSATALLSSGTGFHYSLIGSY